MAARTLTRAPVAALALLAALCLAPAGPAASAADEKKVWRALTEGEPRSTPPAAVTPPRAGAGLKKPFPSETALALVVGGIIAAIVAAGAYQARRRPVPPLVREPREPEEGSHVEELWRSHLRRKHPKGGDKV